MADVKISDLTTDSSPARTALIETETAGGLSRKITLAQVLEANEITAYRDETAAVNDTVPVVAISPVDVSNTDCALTPIGTGALLAQVPDGYIAGGDKRGEYATDFQRPRALTSQVASGGYSVISGGGSNTASGIYSTVSGGFGNTASGWYSFAVGRNNTASGNATVVAGYLNTASGHYGAVLGGYGNTVSGASATVAGGYHNKASGDRSWVPGGGGGETRGLMGAYAYSYDGTAQVLGMPLYVDSTDDVALVCTADGDTVNANNTLVLRNNTGGIVTARCIAIGDGGEVFSTTLSATVARGAGAATTAVVGTVTETPNGATGGFAPVFTLVANTSLGSIDVQYTGINETVTRAASEICIQETRIPN